MKHFLFCVFLIANSFSLMAGELQGFRGDILYFTDNPAKNPAGTKYSPDSVLLVQDGKVVGVQSYKELKQKSPNLKLVDYSGKLIVPGLIDTHVHYPQSEMMAAYGAQLLDWLNNYTFPTEESFSDKKFADKISNFFLDQLLANGTTTAMVFATVYPVSVDSFFEAAQSRNMRMISGKVLMDRNAPPALLDTPESAYTDSKKLLEKWHNKGRLSYAVIPRFAPTSTPEELAMAGKLVKEYPDVYVHTHVAENKTEVKWVAELFPKSRSYLDVYDHYGLVTNHSIFAHGIYLDDQDFSVLSKKGGAIAFCPTSNLFLGSGLFNLGRANDFGVNVGLGTDVAAGTSLSILQTMNEAYKVTQMRKAFVDDPSSVKPLSPMESLYLATLGGAKTLSLDDKIGSFEPGKEADFIVLNSEVKPLLNARTKKAKSLEDRVFALEIMGDDRVVESVYIMGKSMKPK